ncbi:DUF2288 domain-containing protein [Endozoicomonas atrinae]|uniref:DUF2288 domain-containing protein n=1 Tax=Endozoicomonas atrinae TaxID=1333660 RepID=UPI003B00F1F9
MSESVSRETLEKAKLNQETSKIAWSELQRYFAQGVVLRVDDSLDLIDVSYQISVDNKSAVEAWVEQGVLGAVSDEQAQSWFAEDRDLWAVVVRPWVLVQERVQERF